MTRSCHGLAPLHEDGISKNNVLLAPKGLFVVETTRSGDVMECKFRWLVPNLKTGSEGKAYLESITGFQIQHNGLVSLPQKLPRDRLGNLKYQGSVKLLEGVNTVAVRLLFQKEGKRLTPADWTAWSQPLDPAPIGPSFVHVRQGRLLDYLNPSKTLLAASKESQQIEESKRRTSDLLEMKDTETGANRAKSSLKSDIRDVNNVSERCLQPAASTSVAAVLKANENKAVLKLERPGPPNEVRQRFDRTRLSPFVLNPSDTSLSASQPAVPLNFGENLIHQDPLDRFSHPSATTVHAYLKRVLITTKESEKVVLITQPADVDKDLRTVPKGFQPLGDGCIRTVLNPGQQYAAALGDRIAFLDAGVEYIVARQLSETREPARFKVTDPATGLEEPMSIELYMSIAKAFDVYVPTGLVQRAQFHQLFCSDIAKSLCIAEHSVEFISCYPVPSALSPTTEVVFMLLPGGTREQMAYRNQHLGPRVLAAELASLVADSESPLHQCLTLRNAISLKLKIGARLDPSSKSVDRQNCYEPLDGSATASTLSEDSQFVSDEDIENPAPISKDLMASHLKQDGPAHPLRTVEGRLATLLGWQTRALTNGDSSGRDRKELEQSISPLMLARAGFYRIEDPEHFHTLRCAYCRLEISGINALIFPLILHKRSSPTCPTVLGTVNERGIEFRGTHYASKQDDEPGNGEIEEIEPAIDEATAENRVHPEQGDLIAMSQQEAEGDVVLEIEEAVQHEFRGPSFHVRARVYQDLERLAARNDRSKPHSPVGGRERGGEGGLQAARQPGLASQGHNAWIANRSQRKRVERIQESAKHVAFEASSAKEREAQQPANGLERQY